MITHMKHKHLLTFGSVMIVAWAIGTFAFIYFYPHLMYSHFERAITQQGVDANTSSGIPINTL